MTRTKKKQNNKKRTERVSRRDAIEKIIKTTTPSYLEVSRGCSEGD